VILEIVSRDVDADQAAGPLGDDPRLEDPSRFRGTSKATGLTSVITRFARVPLRVGPVAARRVVFLVAQVVGELRLQGRLQDRLLQAGQ
jgi:hypothetical protein